MLQKKSCPVIKAKGERDKNYVQIYTSCIIEDIFFYNKVVI